jgi:hypothetical protein
METLRWINFAVSVLFVVCYAYQFLYIPVPWLKKAAPHAAPRANRYAVLICARNEAAVIGDLIASIRSQTYDQALLSIFVLADNCTDDTALISRCAGAVCYERFNREQVGKGYALQTLLHYLDRDYPAGFDGSVGLRCDFERDDAIDTVIVTHGRIAAECISAKCMLEKSGARVGIVLCEYVAPYDELAEKIAGIVCADTVKNVVFVEEEIRQGGFGMLLSDKLTRSGALCGKKTRIVAAENAFVRCNKGQTYAEAAGVDAASIARTVMMMNE